MKKNFLFALTFLISLFSNTFAKEQPAGLEEKELIYKNWRYKTVLNNQEINLRKFIKGKKLVLVVYFAPWCNNWANEAPIVEKFYKKYHKFGFEVIGISEYAPLNEVEAHIKDKGLTFFVVTESISKDDQKKTLHYQYRQQVGDTRGWGSPWNIFIEPKKGHQFKNDILLNKAFIANGELVEEEAEKFIRQKLHLTK